MVVAVLMRKLGYLDLRRAGGVGELRRKNIRLRSLVKDVSALSGIRGLKIHEGP